MRRTVVVTGTGTEVGKTWVTARLIETLRAQDVSVHVRKPVESFEPGDNDTDSRVLARAAGVDEETVCPPHRRYALAMAPPMAAEALGLEPFSLQDLAGEIEIPGEGITFVEGAGGARSPLADDGDTVGLAALLGAETVLVVADPGLGTINSVVLTVDALAPMRSVVLLNRYDDGDDLHRRNKRWLDEVAGIEVATEIEELAGIIIKEAG